jgi:hypothetical protein
MQHSRFTLTSEQTLRLQELRDALAKTLPAGAAETVAFPVSQFGGCGAVCMPGCTGTCVSTCGNNCQTGCFTTCAGTCEDSCAGTCDIYCMLTHII